MPSETGGSGTDNFVRVLVVDDDPAVADLASDYLEHENNRFEVVTETCATDALERLRDATPPFDCIVSDYDMPHMDGLEFRDAVRSAHDDVPFILFTSKGSELLREFETDDITDYVRKDGHSGLYAELADRVTRAANG